MTNLDMPNDDAFAWLEPKTRIRREGDQDDQEVKDFSLQREQQLSEEEAIRELKKLIKMRLEADPNSSEIALLKSALKKKKKRADNYWKNKKPSTKREKIRAARRRRKELRRLEQIRRKEWRLAHQNPETGDYDEYGAFPGLAELESVDKKQARKQRRQKRKQNSEKKKKTKQQNKKKGSKVSKDRGTFSRTFQFTRPTLKPTVLTTIPVVTTTASTTTTTRTTTTRKTTTTAPTTRRTMPRQTTKKFGRERIYNAMDFFENESFLNATLNSFEYAEYQFAVLNAGRMDDFEGIQTLEKYQLLKLMMIYLQPREFQNWNRFSQYGCHCFQSFDTEFWKGKGVPKDDIDKTCRKLGMCYHCIKNDNPDGSCDPLMQYDFMGLQDPTTSDRFIECLNEPGSCQRNICECDRQMAMSLSKQTETFNINYDPMWGAFDASASCTEKIGSPPWDECCGSYPERMPYASSGTRACCNGKTFEKIFNQCCNDRVVSKGNTCNA